MARIKYPQAFLKRVKLFDLVKAKHDADGTNSVLIPFLTQQSIDLVADALKVLDAMQANTEFEKHSAQSTDMTQDRDNLFDVVFINYRMSAQYLKAFYTGNVRELVNWGVPVDNEGLLNYPSDFLERTVIVKALYTYHNSLGAASPLSPFLVTNSIDVATELTKITDADTLNTNMLQAKRDAERYSTRRDKLFIPVFENIHKIGDFLKKLYPLHPQRLGLWGFDIDASSRSPKETVRSITPNSSTGIRSIKNESVFKNTGNIVLQIYKGMSLSSESVTLNSEEQFTTSHGWGTVTVFNANRTDYGEVTFFSTSNL